MNHVQSHVSKKKKAVVHPKLFLFSLSALIIFSKLGAFFFIFIGYRLSVFQEELKTQVQAQVYINFFCCCCCNDLTPKKYVGFTLGFQ